MNNKRKNLCWKSQKCIKQGMHKYNNTAFIKEYLAKQSAYIKTSSFHKKQHNFHHFIRSSTISFCTINQDLLT